MSRKHKFKINKVNQLILFTLAFTSILFNSSLAAFSFSNPTASPEATAKQATQFVSYADAVTLAAPAVVSIKTTKEIPLNMHPLFQDPLFRHFFGEQSPFLIEPQQPDIGKNEVPKEIQKGLGSGVIVNEKGYVLTNHHVIQDSDSIIVTLPDGRTTDAKIIGVDQDTDLAVLQINLPNLPVIPIGSSGKLRVGDVVLAIGNPFGLDKTVTQGIISATERTGTEIGILENLLQTDAAINPGNSGGALVDAYGKLIGINTAIISRTGGYQGIGFAIPIDQAFDIMKKLIDKGHISRGFLGVSLQNLTPELREQLNFKKGEGVFIRATVHNGPAQKAGLLPGDVITKVNGVEVKDYRTALQLISKLTPGKNYSLELFRKGDHMSFAINVEDRKVHHPSSTKAKANKNLNSENK